MLSNTVQWSMMIMNKLVMIIMTLTVTQRRTLAMRCYTDLEATQSNSLECGMATGCVKILKKAYEFDHLGRFIPEHKRGKDVDLFRGCFLISTPNVCHDAKDGLTYCWCSSGDLCNGGQVIKHNLATTITVLFISILVITRSTISIRMWYEKTSPTFESNLSFQVPAEL